MITRFVFSKFVFSNLKCLIKLGRTQSFSRFLSNAWSISLLMLGLLLGATNAWAEDLPPKDESTLEEIDISADRVKQKKIQGVRNRPLTQHPGAATIITSEEMKKGRYFAATEALRKVSGVHVNTEFGRGLRPNIGIRGLNPNRSSNTLILADGLPIQPAVYGASSAYFNVPAELVDSIEVIKGGVSVIYGPNTVGGVVNYVTIDPPKKNEFRLSETIRQGGFFSTLGSYGNTADNGVGFLLSYLNKSGETVRDNTETFVNDVNLRLVVPTSAGGEVSMRFNYYKEVAETPGGLTVAQFDSDSNQSQRSFDEFFGSRGSFDLRYTQPFSKDFKLDLLSYFNFFERDWFIADGPDPSSPTANGQFLREFFVIGVEPRLRWKNWLAGVRFHHEQQEDIRRKGSSVDARQGKTTREADLTTDAIAAYLEVELMPWKGFTLTPGVRHEAVYQGRSIGLRDKAGGTAADVTTNETLFGVGGVQKITNDLSGYFSVHEAFQPLTFSEAVDASSGTANDLDAETSMNYEVGLRFDRSDRGLYAEFGLFRLDFDNQVVSESGVLVNGGKTRHQGIEASFSYSPSQLQGLAFDGSLTFVDTESLNGPNIGRELPSAPRQLYNWGVEYNRPLAKKRNASLRLEGRYVGQQFSDSANTAAESADGTTGLLPSYSLWNLKADFGTEKWTVFAGVNNLFDKDYKVRRQAFFNGIIPGLTQNFFIGSEIKF